MRASVLASGRTVPGTNQLQATYLPRGAAVARDRDHGARRRRDRRAVGHVRHRRRGRLDARDPGARRDRAPGDRLDAAVDPAVVDLGLAPLPPREHSSCRASC